MRHQREMRAGVDDHVDPLAVRLVEQAGQDRGIGVVVLRVAVLNGAEFEWAAHEPIGRREGLTDLHLRVLRSGSGDQVWSPAQAAVLAFTDASTRGVAVPDDVFAAVREHLDDRQVVELTALVGGYAMVSRFLVALRVPPPDGEVAG